ncbi:hypothetical protein BLOT_016684 [Blomia tropicalis]|nr:hypothetical protein BLOT_016684 [Blomia tropicalis]
MLQEDSQYETSGRIYKSKNFLNITNKINMKECNEIEIGSNLVSLVRNEISEMENCAYGKSESLNHQL